MAPARYTSGEVSSEPLAQPLHFQPSGRVAKNRFCKAPMGEVLSSWSLEVPSERGVPSDELIELYRRWGEGSNNWGVIVTGTIDIEFTSLTNAGTPVITPECPMEGERFEKFQALARAAKSEGSLILGQVNHAGRQVPAEINPEAISASDVQIAPKNGMIFAKPRPATKDDIAHVVEGFAYAAEYLEKAGFDGIQIHGAHGYLISQFLSRATNLRTDEYGVQTTENRLRLVSEIAAAIKARVSSSFMVTAKLNSVEFQDGGVTANEAQEVCACLEKLGFDSVELSGGTAEELGMQWDKESTRRREAYFLEFVDTIMAGFGPDRRIKVYLTGGLRSVGAMVKALDLVDGVALARPAAREPRLAHDIISGRVRDGAARPVADLENNLGPSLLVASSQFAQTAAGKEPFDFGDEAVMKHFMEDIGAFVKQRAEKGLPGPFLVKYTGPEVEYGTEDSVIAA